MLLVSWEEKWRDKYRRTNLVRGLSRIMLIIGKILLPRIGSFTMDNDVLACHDSYLVHQLNAVIDEDDCHSQMAALATMRAVHPRFVRLFKPDDGSS